MLPKLLPDIHTGVPPVVLATTPGALNVAFNTIGGATLVRGTVFTRPSTTRFHVSALPMDSVVVHCTWM